MNSVDLAHIQHQYFLFGGVAPWKNRFHAFANRLRVPALMTVHEFVPPMGKPHVRAAIALTNRRNFQHPRLQRLLVHTEEDRRKLLSSGVPSDRIVVVRHGVPMAPEMPPREGARTKNGLQEKFVITLFGFLSQRKGHLFALQALGKLPEDVVLIFAGGQHPDDHTDYVPSVQQAIQSYNVAEKVRITGYLPSSDVADMLSATDLIIAPFSEVSGSGSLALAFATGRPILASDIPPHREILEDTPGAMLLYPAGNTGAFVETIRRLREDNATREMLAAGAKGYAEKHSYARMAEETVVVYRDILARIR